MDKNSEKSPAHPHTAYENEMLNVLLKVSSSLYQYLNIDELILHIIGLIKEMMEVEAASVILHDEKTDEFVFRWVEDERLTAETRLNAGRFPSSQGIAGSVFASGNPEIVPDVGRDPRHFKRIDVQTGCETRAMIAVPLKKQEKKIGVLQVLNKKEGAFNERDLALLTSIAPIMAMALDNAMMVAELQESYHELKVTDKLKDTLIQQTRDENLRLRQAVESRHRFDQIVGASDAMLEVFKLCEKVMSTDITVLIEGETGTGKEIFARCIHFNSPRKDKPFVGQNCGGIPDTLLASELFGHRRGAFTGAYADKKGLFETAHGGTVFLDEVAEMSSAMQATLLRVLQEGEIKPLGADFTKKVDVRVISATNRDLEAAVREGRFREDLLYRLNVFTIKLPALRQRTGDIPMLARHFIQKYNQKHKRNISGVSREALHCLEAYAFAGNVRELENEIERAVAMADDGGRIETAHLSAKITRGPQAAINRLDTRGTLKEKVENLEKSLLKQMIDEHKGNKTQIAKALGMSRYGLIKKMQRYGL